MAIRELFQEFHKQTPVEKILERNIGSYKIYLVHISTRCKI